MKQGDVRLPGFHHHHHETQNEVHFFPMSFISKRLIVTWTTQQKKKKRCLFFFSFNKWYWTVPSFGVSNLNHRDYSLHRGPVWRLRNVGRWTARVLSFDLSTTETVFALLRQRVNRVESLKFPLINKIWFILQAESIFVLRVQGMKSWRDHKYFIRSGRLVLNKRNLTSSIHIRWNMFYCDLW